MAFTGLPKEMSEFFMQIRFNNNQEFFNENRKAFETHVKKPLYALAQELAPVIEQIDPAVDTRPSKVVSRIRRDTRFSRDKSPYRDHMWLSWRPPHLSVGRAAAPGLYVGINIDSWEVGCGFYEATPLTMRAFRARVQAAPHAFLSIIQEPEFASRFSLYGEEYKRPKIPEGLPEALIPWFSKKNFYVDHTRVMDGLEQQAALAEEAGAYLRTLAPFYRFLSTLPVEE